jgi:hypothetical protein
MSPRGFHQREYISPHFTTNAYKQSDQGKHEAAMEKAVEDWFKGLISVPRKVITKAYLKLLVFAGYLRNL